MLLFRLRRPMCASWFILSACLLKCSLLALLQDNCLDLVFCAFLCKLSGCAKNTTALCQYLPRLILIKLAVLADKHISVKAKYQHNISVYLYFLNTQHQRMHLYGMFFL